MAAKLQLSQEEWKLIADPAWILTKNSVMGKIVEMMAGLSGEYRHALERGLAARGTEQITSTPIDQPPTDRPPIGRNILIDQIMAAGPKISKGENYRGLPWIILDFPRLFGRDDIFAIRTMFWWGHGFSVTLHLKGRYQALFLPVIRGRRAELIAAGFHLAVGDDEWRHEIIPGNYASMAQVELGEDRPFLKLSVLIPLDRWVGPEQLKDLYLLLVEVLTKH